jgi:hypothetical protein
MLAPYMSPNLAIQSRVWMAFCLLSGTSLILIPILESVTNLFTIPLSANSLPSQTINWSSLSSSLPLLMQTHPIQTYSKSVPLNTQCKIPSTTSHVKLDIPRASPPASL